MNVSQISILNPRSFGKVAVLMGGQAGLGGRRLGRAGAACRSSEGVFQRGGA